MTPLAQWAVKNYTSEVRNVGYMILSQPAQRASLMLF
jgi:hypothetical protein